MIHPQFNKFLCYDAWFLTFPTAMLMLANFFPLTLLWPLLNPAYRYILSSCTQAVQLTLQECLSVCASSLRILHYCICSLRDMAAFNAPFRRVMLDRGGVIAFPLMVPVLRSHPYANEFRQDFSSFSFS